MIITHDGDPATPEGISHIDAIRNAAQEAVKGTPLAGSKIYIGGTAATYKDISEMAHYDLIIAGIASLSLILLIMMFITRSLVAALVIVGTVALSLGASVGLSVLVWQHLLGIPLYWVILPLAVILLLAVGSDYNLLLVSRFKEEIHAGINTGIIRSMAGSGSVVTAAGLVFAFTMASFIFSDLLVLGQIGTTIALGLLFDTLIVRSFMTPSIAALARAAGSGGRCGCASGRYRRSSATRTRGSCRCSDPKFAPLRPRNPSHCARDCSHGRDSVLITTVNAISRERGSYRRNDRVIGRRGSAGAQRRGLEHPDQLECGLTRLEPVEQALTRTEYHRADLEIDLIDQSCCDRLPCARGSSCDRDVAPTRSRLSLGVGGLDPVGDEVKGGPALHLDRVVWVVSQDEHRAVVGRDIAPPALPIRVAPFATNWAEHVAAHDRRSHAVHHVGDHLLVDRMVLGGAQVPIMKRHASDAERLLLALAGPGNIAVGRDRHRKVGSGHVASIRP